uniref:Uncharacterized protein n=1 Tax=Siphoviridae sp. ct2wG4 TaxID=2826278 RepID=A0A8S5QXG4_9CAUD|nr:MAG TPA: hypothetical protein [Siphoviridae sp. ct2wG4]DAU49706.1 MAG TPA: hypothetical protein [Caudoviricetes sp.]
MTSELLSQNNWRFSNSMLFHTHFFNTSSIILRSSFNSSSVKPYTLPNAEGFSILRAYFTPPYCFYIGMIPILNRLLISCYF